MSQIRNFAEALYKEKCQDCNETLEWEAKFDADGTTYNASCCGHIYTMFPHSVRIEREKES